MKARALPALAALLAFLLLGAALRHDLAAHFLRQGGERLRAGDAPGAAAALRMSAALGGDAGTLAFHLGVLHYRKGEYDPARRQFDVAVAAAPPGREAAARFNRGNSFYRLAEAAAGRDAQAALGHFRQAMDDYRQALALELGDAGARRNLELAQARWAALAAGPGGREKVDAPRPAPDATPAQGRGENRADAKARAEAKPAAGQGAAKTDDGDDPTPGQRSARALPREEVERLLNEARGRERPAGELHAGDRHGRAARPGRDW